MQFIDNWTHLIHSGGHAMQNKFVQQIIEKKQLICSYDGISNRIHCHISCSIGMLTADKSIAGQLVLR